MEELYYNIRMMHTNTYIKTTDNIAKYFGRTYSSKVKVSIQYWSQKKPLFENPKKPLGSDKVDPDIYQK